MNHLELCTDETSNQNAEFFARHYCIVEVFPQYITDKNFLAFPQLTDLIEYKLFHHKNWKLFQFVSRTDNCKISSLWVFAEFITYSIFLVHTHKYVQFEKKIWYFLSYIKRTMCELSLKKLLRSIKFRSVVAKLALLFLIKLWLFGSLKLIWSDQWEKPVIPL